MIALSLCWAIRGRYKCISDVGAPATRDGCHIRMAIAAQAVTLDSTDTTHPYRSSGFTRHLAANNTTPPWSFSKVDVE